MGQSILREEDFFALECANESVLCAHGRRGTQLLTRCMVVYATEQCSHQHRELILQAVRPPSPIVADRGRWPSRAGSPRWW